MIFSADEIKHILPHRYPFLLVDRIVDITETTAVGIKNISINEPFFEGHFPEQSIMPGNLVVESLAQVSAFVGIPYKSIKKQELTEIGQKGYLISSDVKFRQPAIPGDTITLRVTKYKTLAKMTIFRCEALVEGDVLVKGELSIFHLESNSAIKGAR